MRKRMLQLKALPAVGISVLPKPVLRSSASAGDPTRVVSSSSRAGAAPSSCRSRWPSRSSPPAPPPAPILGLLLRSTDCAQQPLDSLLHLVPHHIADHSDQALPSRHRSSSPPTVSLIANARMVAVERLANSSPSPSKARSLLGKVGPSQRGRL